MADLTKNAISEMVRDRVKRTKIWDYKCQIGRLVISKIVIRASFVFPKQKPFASMIDRSTETDAKHCIVRYLL